MFRINNKKGLIEIVSVAIFILLVVLSLAFTWAAVKNITDLSPEFDCAQLQFEVEKPLTIDNACYNSETKDVELTLKRGFLNNLEFTTINFIVSSDSSSSNYYCGNNCEDARILDAGETMTYFFKMEEANLNSVTVGINGCPFASAEIEDSC